jgi:alkanesulfonate monooxygenase SsuD/methylene tetrahydromethanopterin reductase-like flavin-dependent oxidoreductase (luciferase family)
MKFGLLQFFSWPGRRGDLKAVYDRALERVHIMDQNPYDCVWIAEHHFSTYSVCPSIHLMGMHFAAHSRNLRIGTGVSLAAFYDPIRLAEEVALLDNLTGGRVNWGAGSGFDPTELRVFGVEPEEKHARFRENVDIVLAAWASERLNFEGRFRRYEDLEVLPKPLQDPIPVWMAASSPDACEWTGSRGFNMMQDPHSSMADISTKRVLYEKALADNGHSVSDRDIPVARLLAVAPTDQQAKEVAVNGAAWTTGSYAKQPLAMRKQTNEASPVDRYVDNVILWGSPERVVDELHRYEADHRLDNLIIAPLSRQSFELFTESVLPEFT